MHHLDSTIRIGRFDIPTLERRIVISPRPSEKFLDQLSNRLKPVRKKKGKKNSLIKGIRS